MTFSAHNVVSLFRAKPQIRDWDNAELAQFYRVEAALRQAGIFVDTERGITDEGDPWFVYCRQDSGDVFLHIARFDGLYVAASPTMGTPVLRKKFSELLDELVRDNPVILPTPSRRPGPDLYIHPSTMLIAAVAALFYKNAPIRSDDHGENPLRQAEARGTQSFGMLSDVYSVALVSAMAIIAVLHHSNTDDTVVDDRHVEEQAFLDGILFNQQTGPNDLPSFEGNGGPTGMITNASADSVDVVVTENVVAEASLNTAAALQNLFGKFADTIIAASAAVSANAEMAVVNHRVASAESETVRNEAQVAEGGEKVLPAHTPSSPAFVITAAATPDFKDQSVQQVSLTTTEEPSTKDPGVVQVAAVTTLPAPSNLLDSLDPDTSNQAGNHAPSDPVAPVDMGPAVVLPEEPVAETPQLTFYEYVEVWGMAVLLTPTAADAAPHGGDDIGLVGISAAEVDVHAVA